MLQYPAQRIAIARDQAVELVLAPAHKSPLLFFRNMAQQARAEHGRESQRHEGRDQDGHRQRDREFAEQAPDHVAHEQQRNEHGDQRKGQRDDGEADLLCALERGLQRRLAFLDIARNVFDHHDRVIDHKTGGDGQRHQGEVVDGEIRSDTSRRKSRSTTAARPWPE